MKYYYIEHDQHTLPRPTEVKILKRTKSQVFIKRKSGKEVLVPTKYIFAEDEVSFVENEYYIETEDTFKYKSVSLGKNEAKEVFSALGVYLRIDVESSSFKMPPKDILYIRMCANVIHSFKVKKSFKGTNIKLIQEYSPNTDGKKDRYGHKYLLDLDITKPSNLIYVLQHQGYKSHSLFIHKKNGLFFNYQFSNKETNDLFNVLAEYLDYEIKDYR
jgi:hypothetical protein